MKDEKEQPESMSGVYGGHQRIGELAFKLFGSTAEIDLNLPRHPAHTPLELDQ